MIVSVSRGFRIPFAVEGGTLLVSGSKNITLLVLHYVSFDRKFHFYKDDGSVEKIKKREGYELLDVKDGFELSPIINQKIKEIEERQAIEYQEEKARKRAEKEAQKALKRAQKNTN